LWEKPTTHHILLSAGVNDSNGPGITFFALKAENTPPVWYRDSVQLRLLLQGAWDKVSEPFIEQLADALRAGDEAKIKALAKELEALGLDLSDVLGDKVEAITWNLLGKSYAFWKLHAKDTGIAAPEGVLKWHREKLAHAQAEQIKTFAEKFPERILHPEVIRQVGYLEDADLTSGVEVANLVDRMERAVKNPAYWEGISDVHAARLWHADGIMYARENGILTGRVEGPLDEKTCAVCQHMLGLHVDLDWYADKIEQDLLIQDPDEYVEAWRFPRLTDVDNMSREELAAKGLALPPWHPHCRHAVAWLSKKKYRSAAVAA